jgi:hypothetical protein
VRAGYAVELLAGGTEGIGYLLKDRVADVGELAAALRRLRLGELVMSEDVRRV